MSEWSTGPQTTTTGDCSDQDNVIDIGMKENEAYGTTKSVATQPNEAYGTLGLPKQLDEGYVVVY